MSAPRIVSCLWFDQNAADGVRLYLEALPNARAVTPSYHSGAQDDPGGVARGKELVVAFEAGGRAFTTLNGGPHFTPNPSVSFFVELASDEEVNRTAERLLAGGQVRMPVGAYPWSDRYGWVTDRFGFSWQVMLPRGPIERAAIAPCLMFSDAQRGRAEEAMRAYAEIFPASEVQSLVRYEPGEGPTGSVKHGRVTLAGQTFVAMDSYVSHGVTFNEAISFQVMCRDQAEVDRYYAALSRGGAESRCGWLKDRFGLSWQIVPVDMARWMTGGDRAARDRAMQAMMKMKKLDIAAMDKAFRGE
ncbi:MAG TPA: VOC family protein [Polyangiaceae bacterium]|jgi:predicted 3-demethylubiquinone-9 3-methyltransferase (glyoxalase superfamily)